MSSKVLIFETFLHKLSSFYRENDKEGIEELLDKQKIYHYALKNFEQYKESTDKRFLSWALETLYKTPKTDSMNRKKQRLNNPKKVRK